MSRVRTILAVLLSGLAIPAMGQAARAESVPSALARAELMAFTQARNAEIAASIAAVEAARAVERERALDTQIEALASSPREAEFEAPRNAEIEKSIATVAATRLAEFTAARNAEINSALVAYQNARFAKERNAEINASIAAVNARRSQIETGTISAARSVGEALARIVTCSRYLRNVGFTVVACKE